MTFPIGVIKMPTKATGRSKGLFDLTVPGYILPRREVMVSEA